MAFSTGLSGLNASSKRLDVIGNNIANANTVGMKVSRTEFSELVAGSLGAGGGGGGVAGGGLGVAIGAVTQQFTQGTIDITNNGLDVAINGGGFFQVTQPDGTAAYSRDGQFKLDKTGNIVTNSGANLMGYPTDLTGKTTSTTIQKLTVPTGAPIPAKATSEISAEFNLDSRAKLGSTAVSPATPVPIGSVGTSLTAFDSQGVPVPVNLYFDKAANDSWDAYMPNPNYVKPDATTGLPATVATDTTADGQQNTAHIYVGNMAFDTAGKLTVTTYPGTQATPPLDKGVVPINLYSSNPKIGADAAGTPSSPPGKFPATLNLSTVTQYGTPFAVSALTQDGYTAGNLTNVTITDAGILTTQYSNGQTQARGQVSLADFRNVQGLKPVGAGNWVETITSGQPIQGSPGTGSFGALRTGALESSNVDITAELVSMMTAQRDYQANAQTIKTQDQVMSTLVNLR